MVAKIRPSDFNIGMSLGSWTNTTTKAGLNVKQYQAAYYVQGMRKNRTLSQQYSLIGTRFDDTITIIVYAEQQDQKFTAANIGSDYYDVIDYSPSSGSDPVRYDYYTLKKTTKGA